MSRLLALCLVTAVVAVPAAGAGPATRSDVAALQVALRSAGMYGGTINGAPGPATTEAIIAFQRRQGLAPDGIAGPQTRRALGRLGKPGLGARALASGMEGWDVSELQFLLAGHGFPSGTFDGHFGASLEAAVRRFQRHAGLPQTGVAADQTRAALRQPVPASPLRLAAPTAAPVGDGFGPRDDRFHAGLDFLAGQGEPVSAPRAGRVAWAGPRGSFGNAVVIAHGSGVRTLFAHLSRVDVTVGQRVSAGQTVGLVGSTGRSTGPHLHFEVLVRGAAVDPRGAID